MSDEIDYCIWECGDLKTYFTSSYVGIEGDDGVVKPLFVESVVNGEDLTDKLVIGTIGREEVACSLKSKKLKTPIPSSRFVNLIGHTVYCSRKTPRQYKKGIVKGHYSLFFMSENEENLVGDRLERVDFGKNIIKGLLNKDFPTFNEAMYSLSNGENLSCAFCEHFAVAILKHVEGVVILYKGEICGRAIKGDITLLEVCSDLQEKLSEALG